MTLKLAEGGVADGTLGATPSWGGGICLPGALPSGWADLSGGGQVPPSGGTFSSFGRSRLSGRSYRRFEDSINIRKEKQIYIAVFVHFRRLSHPWRQFR
jgi:hypothetical protein